jgi:hypothetical protein
VKNPFSVMVRAGKQVQDHQCQSGINERWIHFRLAFTLKSKTKKTYTYKPRNHQNPEKNQLKNNKILMQYCEKLFPNMKWK